MKKIISMMAVFAFLFATNAQAFDGLGDKEKNKKKKAKTEQKEKSTSNSNEGKKACSADKKCCSSKKSEEKAS